MIVGDRDNECLALSMEYVKNMYICPDIDNLAELLKMSKVIFIRHIDTENTTTSILSPEEISTVMKKKYFSNTANISLIGVRMKVIDKNNYEVDTETIQYWRGGDTLPNGDHKINSTIKFKFDRDVEQKLFISNVIHEWWIC